MPDAHVDEPDRAVPQDARLRTRRRLVLGALAAAAVAVVAVTVWVIAGDDPAPTPEANVQTSTVPGLDAKSGLEVGDVAPDFTLPGLNGGTVTLSSFRGTPVVLNFWASWCAPCRAEFPELQKVQDGGDAVVVGVSQRDKIESDLRDFAHDQHATWPLAFDENDIVGDAYRVPSVPVTYFIDADGVIRHRQFSQLSEADLEAGLATITPPR